MVNFFNPLVIIVPVLVAVLLVLALIAAILPWRGYLMYGAVVMGSSLPLYYGTTLSTGLVLLGALIALFALLLALPLHALRARKRGSPQPSAWRTAFGLALIPLFSFLTIDRTALAWHAAQLPPGFRLSHAVYAPRHPLKSCEVTVWALHSPDSGLQAAHTAGSAWLPTPYPQRDSPSDPRDRWLKALACSGLELELKELLLDALNASGSLYVSENNEGFVVLPNTGYLAHLYDR
jgi:hypothetical protein